MSNPSEHTDSTDEGQVSETGFEGDVADIDADAVPSEHSTEGPDDADV